MTPRKDDAPLDRVAMGPVKESKPHQAALSKIMLIVIHAQGDIQLDTLRKRHSTLSQEADPKACGLLCASPHGKDVR